MTPTQEPTTQETSELVPASLMAEGLIGLTQAAACFADGLDALPHDRTGRPLGTGRTLSDPQAQQIQKQLDAHSPEELGIPAPLWTRPAVQQLIRKELGIAMPVRTVGSYLHRWGYTAKR